jgi:NAD(P)-dependent dehydrogenase (short-subunit alcohol dehydrogenase family)
MSLDQFRIDSKVALITGGYRSIGLGITRLFGEAGAKCMLTGRSRTDEVDALIGGDGDAKCLRTRGRNRPGDARKASAEHGRKVRPARHSGEQRGHFSCRRRR